MAKRLTVSHLYLSSLLQARPHWRQLSTVLFMGMLATPIALLTPLPLKIILDNVLGSQPPPPLLSILPEDAIGSVPTMLIIAVALAVLTALLIGLHSFAEWFLRERVAERMLMDLRVRLFDRSLHSGAVIRGASDRSDTLYRITHDARCLQWTLVYGVIPILVSLISVVVMIYVMAQLSGKTAFVGAATCLPLVILMYVSQRRLRDQWHRVKSAESRALGVIQDALDGLHVVKAFGQEERERSRFVDRSAEMVDSRMTVVRLQGVVGVVLGCTTALGIAATLYLGVRDVQANLLSVGELLLVVTYIGQLYGPLQAIGSRMVEQQSAIASTERAFEALAAEPEILERPGATPLGTARGAFRLENVSFAYPGRFATLSGVSLEIPAGSYVGIIGETGAGKTTLVNLLMRQFDPGSGQILLDGIDLCDCNIADLRRQFAVVPQHGVLFATSIAENIAYGKPAATMEEVVVAAKKARAHEFIERLDDGYHTRISNDGARLSAGERQRVSLARAFLKDAPILVLDEPTSAIDVRTEESLLASIEDLARGRTTLLITHRLSMLRNADMVLYVENGHVAAVDSAAWAEVPLVSAFSQRSQPV